MCKFNGESLNIEQSEREKLRAVFPQCFYEGRLDIDKLLSLCGEYIDNDFEKYKFEWNGKSACLRLAQKPSTGTLRPCPAESVNFDTTGNLYIEGDNLEVLKLLQTSYFRRVKMIYIDPPYNTGSDFVYADDFADPLARYREVTRQTTKSNPETMGRFHTNWLNMMYPRLRLAANLLRDDGVIFISIDDHEAHNLRKLCDEVFGEENFRNIFVLKRYDKNINRQFAEEGLASFNTGFEYVVCYSKSSEFKFNAIYRVTSKERQSSGYWKGFWNAADRPTMRYEILGFTPQEGQWKWSRAKAEEAVKNYIEYEEKFSFCMNLEKYWEKTGKNKKFIRRNLSGKAKNMGVEHWIEPLPSILRNTNWLDLFASKTINEMKGLFDFPKNSDALKLMIECARANDSIILDFFSGSATTAHAVMELNKEDGGRRKFIMVQLPEVCDEKSEAFRAGYRNICEIGKERIRRAGARLLAADDEQNGQGRQLQLPDRAPHQPPDVGFRCFRLDTSNLVAWDATPVPDGDLRTLWDRFDALASTIKPDRSDLDIVFEVMLKMGVPLDYPVSSITVNGKKAYSIGEDCLLLVCLDTGITPGDIEALCDLAPAKIIAAEAAFIDDSALSNAYYILRDRDIEMKLL